MMSSSSRLFVIDTDVGVDDAQAIFMALAQPDVTVLAITTVHGNVSVQQVCTNVLRVLKVADRLDIPVYRGCDRSLSGSMVELSDYHGRDGLGDAPDPDSPGLELIQPGHSAVLLTQLAKQYPGQITLLGLGPLTNIAMAMRLDPEFGGNLKESFIMGGNYEGKGNISASAEFNFHTDPEAAKIVLEELGCPITLVCWELCLKHTLPWEWYYNDFVGIQSKKAQFMKTVEESIIQTFYKPYPERNYTTADQAAMAAAITRKVQKSQKTVNCTVEVYGQNTRGQMVVDWSGLHLENKNNITIITELNQDVYISLLLQALKS